MEYRNAGQLEFRVKDKTAGIVEARTNQLEVVDDYVSVFASGFWDRIVARSNKLPKILVDHEGRRAGRVTETRQVQSADGLFQHCTLQYDLDSRYGAEAFHDILSGSDDEFSHGFVTARQHAEKRDGQNVMVKDECRMWPEVSQVLAGASPGTGPISIRSALALLGLPDLRATPVFDGAQCPYCNGTADASAEDCTCEGDCGAANCPQAADTQRSLFLKGGSLETPSPAPTRALPLDLASGALALDTRAGARNAAADLKRIQAMHDLSAELGAACAEPDADDGGSPSQLAAEEARAILTRAYRLRLDAAALT